MRSARGKKTPSDALAEKQSYPICSIFLMHASAVCRPHRKLPHKVFQLCSSAHISTTCALTDAYCCWSGSWTVRVAAPQKWHSISLVEPVAKRKTPTFVQIIELQKSIPNRDSKTIAKIDSNPRRTPCTAAGTEVGAVSKAVC